MKKLDDLLEEAGCRQLVGWDLSYDGRIRNVAPWDFEGVVDEYVRQSPNLLDMGTGGGEWLSRRPFRPGQTFATEAYAPNVPVARARLAPLGVEVLTVGDAPDNATQSAGMEYERLPFSDAFLHLITNRHESFVAQEIMRALAPGGSFITQQVASGFNESFYRVMSMPVEPVTEPWTLKVAVEQLERVGFIVERREEGATLMSFADVGALAWYLKNVPFVFPEFSIGDFRDQLSKLHQQIEIEGALVVSEPLFWLAARKPWKDQE